MGVSLLLRTLHRDSHFRTNFRVLEKRGDRNREVSASLRGTTSTVSFGSFAGFLICQPRRGFVIRNGAKDLERRLPLPRVIGIFSVKE